MDSIIYFVVVLFFYISPLSTVSFGKKKKEKEKTKTASFFGVNLGVFQYNLNFS